MSGAQKARARSSRNLDMWSEYAPVIGDEIGVQGGRGSAGMLGGLLHFWISVCKNQAASQQCAVSSSSAFKGNAKPITAQCHCRAQLGNLQHQCKLPACYQGPISKNTLRPKYSYTHCIPFNTYSSSLQMQHLGGSCWVHFLKTGKTHFQTGFSPACWVCHE